MSASLSDTTGSEPAGDNLVLPFAVKPLGVRGRIVRLGAVVDTIVHQHAYPAPVSALLAKAVALTAMLGASLKFDGKFILQTRSDGPVDMLVADFTTPGLVRGYAHFDRARVEQMEASGEVTEADLIGKGHLAMTIDQGRDTERYQGIVSLGEGTLSDAAHNYFQQSEQIPTQVRLSSGPLMGRGDDAAENWRAGAIMIQHLPEEGGIVPFVPDAEDPSADLEGTGGEPDDWVKARFLHQSVEDHELLDPTLAPERLLYRLFHEDGVIAFPSTGIERHCTCSREAVEAVIAGFSDEERQDMTEDGLIVATCEFCSRRYEFDPADFGKEASRVQS